MSDRRVPVFPGEIADLVEESHSSSESGWRDGTDVPQSADEPVVIDEPLVITVLDAVDAVPRQHFVRWHPAATLRAKLGIAVVRHTRVVSASIAARRKCGTIPTPPAPPKPPTVVVNDRHQIISIPGSDRSAKRQLRAWIGWEGMAFWKRKS